MNITTYQIQNVLRTYGKHLTRRDSASKLKRALSNSIDPEAQDSIRLSAEARRRQVVSRISEQLVSRLTSQGQYRGLEQDALTKLSEEFGKRLEVSTEEETELPVFMVEEEGQMHPLAEETSRQLRERLYKITEQIVDENMVR